MATNSTGDPDADAVLQQMLQPQVSSQTASTQSSTGDPDADAVMQHYATTAEPTTWDRVRGAAEAGAHIATGAAAGLGGGLTYLGTLAASGDPGAAKAVQKATG